MVLRSPEVDDDEDGWDEAGDSHEPPSAMVIAETDTTVRTMTVSMAVLELDLTESQTIVFRNAAHGGLSVVYRRPDGNIGWIDPERTRSVAGASA
ncbi:MAG: sigma 54 modulation/S30EA ribosomal C-terminal domain-containing protein [Caulobacteraceae bacterium]